MREDVFSLRVCNELTGAGIFDRTQTLSWVPRPAAAPLKVAPSQVGTTSRESSDPGSTVSRLIGRIVPSPIRPIAPPSIWKILLGAPVSESPVNRAIKPRSRCWTPFRSVADPVSPG
jgi:hypothetical protein